MSVTQESVHHVVHHVASGSAIGVVIVFGLIAVAIAIALVIIVIKSKQGKDERRWEASSKLSPQTSRSSSPEPVLFVAMTRRKDFSDDPVTLFQNASAYWVGSPKQWEDGPKSVDLHVETLQKSDIASLLEEDLLLITYPTKCLPQSIPQNRFNIQAFFRHKKGLQPTYQKLPRHEHSIMDKFIKYFKG